MPRVSIVMSTYNRAPLLAKTLTSIRIQEFKDYEILIVDDGSDEGATELLCDRARHMFPALHYFKRVREPGTHYSNPAIPNNIGLKRATGLITILQNSECVHYTNEVIRCFAEEIKVGEALFATVAAVRADDSFEQWYTHREFSPRPFFFCGALHTEVFHELRGIDQDYKYYSHDDNDFADRLSKKGIKFTFSDTILVKHQYHGPSFKQEDAQRNYLNALLYQAKTNDMAAGKIGIVRNLDGWGEL